MTDRLDRIEHAIVYAFSGTAVLPRVLEILYPDEILNNEFNHAAILAELKKIPWADWVEWVAMDRDGQWWGYESKPNNLSEVDNSWANTNGRIANCDCITMPAIPAEFWKECLFKVK